MAFKLSKSENDDHSALIDKLTSATEALIASQTDEIVAAYNTTIAECEEFRSNVADRLRDEFDDKSEKWQESDAGSDADEFASTWEDLALDEYDASEEAISEGEVDDLRNLLDDFTNLPDAASS